MTPDDGAREALRQCATGALSANMALMRLCLNARTSRAARRALETAVSEADVSERERLLRLVALWRETPDAFALVKAVIGADDRCKEQENDPVACRAAAFDTAAAISPAASVALYSLGREDLLVAATDEVVSYLLKEELFRPGASLVDIGCGTGRFAAALAPSASRVIGIDISEIMLARARERCKILGNVEFLLGDGRGFPSIDGESVDLALAIDVFPYLVEAGEGIVHSNAEDIHRILRPSGRLVVINYSYRGGDEAGVRALAAKVGFELRLIGIRPFRTWDGAVFDLVPIQRS